MLARTWLKPRDQPECDTAASVYMLVSCESYLVTSYQVIPNVLIASFADDLVIKSSLVTV